MNKIRVFERRDYSKLKEVQNNMPPRFGCVYVLEYGDSIKIGCTVKPYSRMASLKIVAENYGNAPLGRIAILPCCSNYGIIEGNLHSAFRKHRKPGTELFDLKFDEVLCEIEKKNLRYRKRVEEKRETAGDEPEEEIKFIPWFMEGIEHVGEK